MGTGPVCSPTRVARTRDQVGYIEIFIGDSGTALSPETIGTAATGTDAQNCCESRDNH